MSRQRGRVSALLAVAVAGTGLGLTASSAIAAECPDNYSSCVVVSVVETVGGQTKVLNTYTLAGEDLQAMSDPEAAINQAQYAVRKNPSSKGGKAQTRPPSGRRVAINDLLTSLDPALVGTATYLETPNAAGVPAVLSTGDLAPVDADGDGKPDAPPFVDGLQPAVVALSGNRIGYIRPLRDPEEDTNASDYFQVTGRLDLTIHTTGQLLTPTVTSSAGTELDRGSKTTFSVSFADEPGADITSTTWDFGDGSVKGTKRDAPSKSYAKKGTYPVAVAVRADDGSYGRSSAIEIKVANPPKAPSSGTGGGSGLGGSPSGGGGGGGALPPAYDPFADEPSAPDEFEEPSVEPDDLEPVPVDDGLEPVEGFVLAGAEIVPGGTPETIPGTQDSNAPAPATQESLRTRVATWLVAAVAIALLIGIGAASETRWFRNILRGSTLRYPRRRA